ncbi:hypothetical protein KPH14_002143 [Odynerus spinipes]|uniref:EFHB C-terminal EF-hand domain-containing protein n=1 Tax=Odynerus spinipes TaxID=1348599 RepID=A0AAD9VNY2_9HYME|nr:hypothetical protein KPH14_002143 [Odynerus spinipes]
MANSGKKPDNQSGNARSKHKNDPDSNSTVKECLQYQHLTPFQTLVWELQNTVMKSYWNKEVGKTHYLVPYLPMGMDPLQTTFGKKFKSDATVAELINPPEIEKKSVTRGDVSLCRFRETSEDEGAQINRNYNCHFNERACFGKKTNSDIKGLRVKRIIKGGNCDTTTLVNHVQADFLKRTQLTLGQVKNSNAVCLPPSTVFGKPSEKETFSVADALKGSSVDDEPILKWKYLRYLHSLRDNLKKHVPSTHFLDIYEDLVSIDEEFTGTLSKEDVFAVLGKYNIHPIRELFDALLDILGLWQNGKLYYKNVVDILNWKCPFPTLPITKNKNNANITTTPVEDENKAYMIAPKQCAHDDKEYSRIDSAYALIFPSIFTKYNLNHTDFFKIRSKEEIRNIFENIGVTFPDNSFDTIWEKGIELDGTDGVCVDTFNALLDSFTNDSYKST